MKVKTRGFGKDKKIIKKKKDLLGPARKGSAGSVQINWAALIIKT